MTLSIQSDYTNGTAVDGGKFTTEFNNVYAEISGHVASSPAEHANGSITVDLLGNSAVTTIKINADAVDGTKIADDSVDSEHIVDGSIDTAHLSATCVTTAKCAAGVAGYHGFLTRIPLLPSDFVSGDVGFAVNDHANPVTGKSFAAGNKILFATVKIPSGYKATAVGVYGQTNTNAVTVYECNINTATASSKGTGTVDASGTDPAPNEINITDVTASATNYLSIVVENSTAVWGGYVTIAEVTP